MRVGLTRRYRPGDVDPDRLLAIFLANAERPVGECWPWTGGLTAQGYGRIYIGDAMVLAHRYAHEHHIGPIPDGLEIDHLCNNRRCVNPTHLEAVTHAENVRRAGERQTACRRAGHDWSDPRNVRVRKNGHRFCAECDRIDKRVARRG